MARDWSGLPNSFWRVSSYGYPSPFGGTKARTAWDTFLSFFEREKYDELKETWLSGKLGRTIDPHTVESWKATFEEFGLLYVAAGSNRVSITPAGLQLRAAGESGDEAGYAWIGLNLLFRFPLGGFRRSGDSRGTTSDLLLYRFFYAAMLDLQNSLWWPEIELLLCRVDSTGATASAVDAVRAVRNKPESLLQLKLPASSRHGAFYNSLNQVVVHAGMNGLLVDSERAPGPYGSASDVRHHSIAAGWRSMVAAALSFGGNQTMCAAGGSTVARLATAPFHDDEAKYFAYLGAAVRPREEMEVSTNPTMLSIAGELVRYLQESIDYEVLAPSMIRGDVSVLCQLARGDRVVLTSDESWTYLVDEKILETANRVRVIVRKARPITNFRVIQKLAKGDANV